MKIWLLTRLRLASFIIIKMSSHHRLTTGTVVSDDNMHHRSPYIELKVVQAVNLNMFMEYLEELRPYISITQNASEWATKPTRYSNGSYMWGQTLDLHIDTSQPFKILILDKDEYGADNSIAGFIMPPDFLSDLSDSPKKFWLRITPPKNMLKTVIDVQDLSEIDHKVLGSPNEKSPMLLIELRYVDPDAMSTFTITMGKFRNIIDNKDSHTLYEAFVTRNDGASWRIEFRYSQVYQLRREIVQVLPSLKKVPFPNRTYFDWLGFLCMRLSKFDQDRINLRKEQIQNFINVVLENLQSIKSQSLVNLLNLPVN